jgi:uncharacterized cupin superfamily protein
MATKINKADVPDNVGTRYPPPHDEPCKGRRWKRVGDAAGLSQFGVSLFRLPPGVWSSQRHWHSAEDEFVYVLSGEVTLITDKGEEVLRAGDCAAFPKGEPNGHQLINKSDMIVVCLEVGTRSNDDFCIYSDIDMQIDAKDGRYRHKDGTPYLERQT